MSIGEDKPEEIDLRDQTISEEEMSEKGFNLFGTVTLPPSDLEGEDLTDPLVAAFREGRQQDLVEGELQVATVMLEYGPENVRVTRYTQPEAVRHAAWGAPATHAIYVHKGVYQPAEREFDIAAALQAALAKDERDA